MDELTNKLNELKSNCSHLKSGEEVRRIENQIDNILLDDENFWKQRSRADWLKEGDKNTKFFHSKASTRKEKNRIRGLEDENGSWIKDMEVVEKMFGEHFKKIFTTTMPSQEQMDAAISDLPAKITGEMEDYLDQLFTEEEIVEALA